MSLNLIVAHDKNKVIGNGLNIPWDIKGEQKLFKELTENNIVIMGRKTYESIGKKLPDRINIVITSNENFKEELFLFKANSLSDAVNMCVNNIIGNHNIYIIGGGTVYKEAIETLDIDYMYITEIDGTFEGDIYFPDFNESKYDKQILDDVKTDDGYHYIKYLYSKK